MREAERNGGKIAWVNCGLCVDERGDFWQLAEASDNTLVIATR